ncbi:hypothetical protein CYLTODRAFT_344696 [Cylindrobasidium torrendii FP15055 ss-10]|uniref:Snf7-domain-containing protein n=1 Tax=Cylindrobasidium torrendii FP15055 ss-10 TaxID=1314674 RepID=A0A0D7BNP3_9AGAR|nr:hypothetical protein CYLTODRAFT_344696 [Cylindrobasidium torrendii FP15055 ss-10]
MVPDSPHLKLQSYKTSSKSRLQATYSDFTNQKTANPAAFHANVEWWRKTLESLVSQGAQASTSDRLVLVASRALLDTLKVDGVGKPIALGNVIVSIVYISALMPSSTFLSQVQSIYTRPSVIRAIPAIVGSYLIAKPLWWSLEQMNIVGQDGIFGGGDASSSTKWHGDYAVIHLIERAAEKVIEAQEDKSTGPADALYTLDSFRKEFASSVGLTDGTPMSLRDADVLLKFMERDKQVVVRQKNVVKFVTGAATTITAVDEGILELKDAVTSMYSQVDSLHKRIDSLTQRAGEALKYKRKPMALNLIRTRKQVEGLLQKRLGALENLESTLISVEAAAGDVEIMQIYAQSSATLKTILSHPSLQCDSIEATMDALADANADARDIDEAIRNGAEVASGETYDESALQNELESLLQEQLAEKAVEDERKLPSVPQDVPETTVPLGTNAKKVLVSHT